MEYLSQPALFKAQKILRYATMYGVSRTYIKVRGQLHTRETNRPSALYRKNPQQSQSVALIGCGNYGFSNIAYYLRKRYGNILRTCMDVNPARAASLGRYFDVAVATDDANEIFKDAGVRLVYIASNHASHAEYAIQALHHGKDIYIEKPHVVTSDQLRRLVQAMNDSSGKVFLGFNRPGSRFGRLIDEHLCREPGAGMYNWFVAGHAIDPDHWYFRQEEGGRVLGNLCHWTDFILRLIPEEGRYPVLINPTRAQASDCNIAVTYTFADGTIAAVTFSAKGHTFEGVRERFTAHKGNCLIFMDDYRNMTIEVGHHKRRYRNLYRDQGHERNIIMACDSMRYDLPYDRSAQLRYIADTGWLFLNTKAALDSGRQIQMPSFTESAGSTCGGAHGQGPRLPAPEGEGRC